MTKWVGNMHMHGYVHGRPTSTLTDGSRFKIPTTDSYLQDVADDLETRIARRETEASNGVIKNGVIKIDISQSTSHPRKDRIREDTIIKHSSRHHRSFHRAGHNCSNIYRDRRACRYRSWRPLCIQGGETEARISSPAAGGACAGNSTKSSSGVLEKY